MNGNTGLFIIVIICALGCVGTSFLTGDQIVGLCVLMVVLVIGLCAALLVCATAYGLARELIALARAVTRAAR